MINLDQVRTLEWKVKQAVQLIVHLRRENDTLRGRLSDTEVRIQELESLLESFKANQNEMESGIRSALEELDHLEGTEVAPEDVAGPVDSFVLPPVVVDSAEVTADEDVSMEEEVEAEVVLTSDEALGDDSFIGESVTQEEPFVAPDSFPEIVEVSEVPESVELQESPAPEEVVSQKPVQEDREPEQPGLGIF